MTTRVRALVEQLLDGAGIRYHAIESRTKTVESFQEKISRPDKNYSDPLAQISDLVGIRVLLYYGDDIERVTNLIVPEFKVIEQHAGHDTNLMEADRFGYLSTHCILELNKTRAALAEWKAHRGKKFELQIRTMLQHSWAAISHSLQYKHETDVPTHLRRRLNRVAGLFELADAEFISIRESHAQLAALDKGKLASGRTDVQLTADAVEQFFDDWSERQAIEDLATEAGFNVRQMGARDSDRYNSQLIKIGAKIGITTIDDLKRVVLNNPQPYFDSLVAAGKSSNTSSKWQVNFGFLALLQVIRAGGAEISIADLNEWNIGIAERVLSVARAHPLSET
jgi:putative GTP pyrophosphokinase